MNVKRGGSSLLLIELFIALMFFSLASAICLQLFIGARDLSQEASNKSRAAIESQNIAESFKAAGGDLAETARLLDCAASGGRLELLFDENWNRTERDGEFLASLNVTLDSGGLITGVLQISRDGQILIEYEVAAVEVAL